MLIAHFQMLARYNTEANRRLYEACARLDDAEYRKQRAGSFGSIHGLLNHILLGDRVWMWRFTETGGAVTPPLNTELCSGFAELRLERVEHDAHIEAFINALNESFFTREFSYVNNAGKRCCDPAPLLLQHMFNHQTHHRGQVTVMLSQTAVRPPVLDLHRIERP